MKKLLAVLSVAALLAPALAFAAAGDVKMTADASFLVGSIPINVSGSAVSVSSVTVDGSSIAFTLAPTDIFTISAPNFNRLFTNTVNGLSVDSCNTTQSLLTYTGGSATETVTVTPSATTFCNNQTGGGSGSGSSNNTTTTTTTSSSGGGGGAITTTPTTPTTSTAPAVNPSGLSETQVQAIISLLNSFGGIDQATIVNVTASLRGTSSGSSSTSVTTATNSSFTRNLTIGATVSDVLALQKYLNAHGFTVAASGAGSSGNETTTFGAATKAALIKFQKANNISPASGYFGPLTRAVVNANQ
jgi:hypothetical protein